MNKEKLTLAYNKLKEELNEYRNYETLRKYEILLKAFKLGKKIHGQRFNHAKLSQDFEIPYTTVKRILALEKANDKTWEKINSGKITSFRAAQILMQKDTSLQDASIDFIIKNNLTTYQIKKLKNKSLCEIREYRLELAVKEGFARKDTAYNSFEVYLNKLIRLLLLKPEYLPKSKISTLKEKLIKVRGMIDNYIDAL